MNRDDYRKIRGTPVRALLRQATGFKGRSLKRSDVDAFAEEHNLNVKELMESCEDLARMSADGEAWKARATADTIALKIIKANERNESLLPADDPAEPDTAATKAIADAARERETGYSKRSGLAGTSFQDGSTL